MSWRPSRMFRHIPPVPKATSSSRKGRTRTHIGAETSSTVLVVHHITSPAQRCTCRRSLFYVSEVSIVVVHIWSGCNSKAGTTRSATTSSHTSGPTSTSYVLCKPLTEFGALAILFLCIQLALHDHLPATHRPSPFSLPPWRFHLPSRCSLHPGLQPYGWQWNPRCHHDSRDRRNTSHTTSLPKSHLQRIGG